LHNLPSVFVLSERLIDAGGGICTRRYLPRGFIESNGFQIVAIVAIINSLNDSLRARENCEGIPTDIDLE
jgi:hypothetical protein